MTIGIIADSTASLSDKYVKENDIGIAHFRYRLDGETFIEGLDESTKDFHKRLKASGSIPQTSQPPIGEYIDLFEDYSKRYDEVLVITMSKGLSGAFQTAQMASQNYDNVRVLDTNLTLDANRFLIENIMKLREEGLGANEIGDIIERDKTYPNLSAILVANDLSYLEKGGRIPSAIRKVGDFLRLKPIINLNADNDGKLGVAEISRGDKKTLKRVVDLIPEDAKRVAVGEVNNQEIKDTIVERIKDQRPDLEVTDCTITPVIASHIGPNCYGMFYSKV